MDEDAEEHDNYLAYVVQHCGDVDQQHNDLYGVGSGDDGPYRPRKGTSTVRCVGLSVGPSRYRPDISCAGKPRLGVARNLSDRPFRASRNILTD